jgi:primosomal protein N' (replication factor Y)
LPDVRAAERTFQLISQVAGRAGRGELAGRIIVQTLVPEHPAVRCAARHDYVSFASQESALRFEVGYPPHGQLIRLVFEDEQETRARIAAEAAADELRSALGSTGVVVLGPAPAPIELARGRYCQNVLLKVSRDGRGLAEAKAKLRQVYVRSSHSRTTIDVDPWNML